MQLGKVGSAQRDSVDVELEALETARDARRQRVDEEAQPEAPRDGCAALEHRQRRELRLHDPIA